MLVAKKKADLVVIFLHLEVARLDQPLLLLVSPREDAPVECSRRTDENEVTDSKPMPEVEARAVSV